MSDYKPGTVAMLRSPMGQEFLAVRTHGGESDYWSAPKGWPLGVPADECDVRPLVVLDPDDAEQVERLAGLLVEHRATDAIAHSGVRDALRATTRPPKPPEPTGLGAVVEDADGNKWTRIYPGKGAGSAWYCDEPRHRDPHNDGQWKHFADIDAVRVLSEGVRP